VGTDGHKGRTLHVGNNVATPTSRKTFNRGNARKDAPPPGSPFFGVWQGATHHRRQA